MRSGAEGFSFSRCTFFLLPLRFFETPHKKDFSFATTSLTSYEKKKKEADMKVSLFFFVFFDGFLANCKATKSKRKGKKLLIKNDDDALADEE